jgi:hypothetical protein
VAIKVKAVAMAAVKLQTSLARLYVALDELGGVELEEAQLPSKVIEARDNVTATIISTLPILNMLGKTPAQAGVAVADPEVPGLVVAEPAVRTGTAIPVDATLAAKVVAKVVETALAEPMTLQTILM